jgi:hypothetical protein
VQVSKQAPFRGIPSPALTIDRYDGGAPLPAYFIHLSMADVREQLLSSASHTPEYIVLIKSIYGDGCVALTAMPVS